MVKEYQNKNNKIYNRDDIKNWVKFGLDNGYINQYKKNEIAKWVDLMLKHGVVNLSTNNNRSY